MGAGVPMRVLRVRQEGRMGAVLQQGGHVVCSACLRGYMSGPVPLYHENIGGYKQSCHRCGRELHMGREGWPELFDKEGCKLCN